ncbi:hypothetical protein [Candidatus Aquicultor sp.]
MAFRKALSTFSSALNTMVYTLLTVTIGLDTVNRMCDIRKSAEPVAMLMLSLSGTPIV